ncbi:MAG: hypothetical protein NC932_02850 [Candidatus Omnitrophica bacterium]|nr:hypothetical protein [Candidatus Omnitrophota bacterium]
METLNYKLIEKSFCWLCEKRQKAIISPDIDGVLSGLFMSSVLDWEIVGFYDGKILCHKEEIKVKDCIFLDIEFFRIKVRSCGHHILIYNKNILPCNWENFEASINPNTLRNFDYLHDFKKKYPLATVHFLLCCITEITGILLDLPNTSVVPLLYVDGTFKNLLNYPENCNEWLYYLNAKNQESPIFPIFEIFPKQKLKDIIHLLKDIFSKFDEIKVNNRRGDKIYLEHIINNPYDFEVYKPLLELLSKYTGWKFKREKWLIDKLKIYNFEKKIENNLQGDKYKEIIEKQSPLSWAITASKRMEYTIGKIE